MIHYLIQTVVFQLLFLLVYDVFLKKETFFNWNRWYLLGTAVLSLVLPFVQIAAISQQISPQMRVQLPAVFIGGEGFVPTAVKTEQFVFPWELFWQIGMLLMSLWFLYKLVRILNLKRKGQSTRLKDFVLVILPDSKAAFTFFKTVFLGGSLGPKQRETILLHEQVHVKERHTLDQLFFELLRIVFWFNPLVYMYQGRMTSLQEFIADAKVAQRQGKSAYYQELLSQVFQTENVSFINTFFNHSLIKKRINMLQKSRSSRSKLLKFVVLLPLVAMMVVYTSCSEEVAEPEAIAAKSGDDADVMAKIVELSEAIMAKGNLTEEEARALQFLATPAQEGDKIYESVEQYLTETEGKVVDGREIHFDQDKGVPFVVVDQAPVYPGCSGTGQALKDCMAQKITQAVNNSFNVDLANKFGLEGTQKIVVQFKISANGDVVDVNARAPHEGLKEEAVRVVSALPKMAPGQHEGKNVAVLYSLPILFKVSATD